MDEDDDIQDYVSSRQRALALEYDYERTLRNATLEEVAAEFDKMKVFGDTATSFAAFVRSMKK
jgi:hypothetical protein